MMIMHLINLINFRRTLRVPLAAGDDLPSLRSPEVCSDTVVSTTGAISGALAMFLHQYVPRLLPSVSSSRQESHGIGLGLDSHLSFSQSGGRQPPTSQKARWPPTFRGRDSASRPEAMTRRGVRRRECRANRLEGGLCTWTLWRRVPPFVGEVGQPLWPRCLRINLVDLPG